jgi:hypothetical protein
VAPHGEKAVCCGAGSILFCGSQFAYIKGSSSLTLYNIIIKVVTGTFFCSILRYYNEINKLETKNFFNIESTEYTQAVPNSQQVDETTDKE